MLTAPGEDVGPLAALQARWQEPATASGPQRAGRASRRRSAGCAISSSVFGRASRCRSTTCRRAGSPPARNRWCSGRIGSSPTTERPMRGNALKLDHVGVRADRSGPADSGNGRRAGAIRRVLHAFLRPVPRRVLRLGARPHVPDQPPRDRIRCAGPPSAERRFPQPDGLLPRRRPLYELVLDAGEQRQLDGLWQELDFITLAPVRQFKQFIWFERAEPPSFMATSQFDVFRSEDKDVTSEAKMAQLAEVYLAKAREIDQRRRAWEWSATTSQQMNANVRAVETGHGGGRTESPRCAGRVRRAGVSPAADEDGSRRPARLLSLAARATPQSRRRDPRRGRQRADVAALLLSRRPADR